MTLVDEAVHAYAARVGPRAAQAVSAAAQRVPALAARLRHAGLAPEELTDQSLSRLPVLSKDEVIDLQRDAPPFGGLLASDVRCERVFQSPGPLYEPQLPGPDPWRWAEALIAAGFGPADLVLNCFGYHLSPAGAMFDAGCQAVGASVVPGGIGNQDLQARAVADLGITAYTGLPSYLKAIMDRWADLGLSWDRWRLSRALVTAEPLPDSLRAALMERVPVVLMAYGTAEVGLIGYETAPGSGLVPAADVLVEICDLDTGAPITSGEGEVVVTLLRSEYPLVRFGTGDLSAWTTDPQGRLRLAGVLGRVGQAIKVRGMFLHPRQAAAVLDADPDVAAWRLVVQRVDHRDELGCDIVARPDADGSAAAVEHLADRVGARIRDGLRFGAQVRLVDAIPEGERGLVDQRTWD